MKKKIIGIFVCMLLIATTGITVAGTFKQAEEINKDSSTEPGNNLGWGWYNPEGAWRRYDNELFYTASRAGLGRYSVICEGKSLDPTWFGTFPEAVDLSLMYGEMVVSSKNKYDLTLIDYAINENYEILYFRVWNGFTKMTSKDTATSNFTAAFYGPNQDPFGDEEPLYGYSGPFEFLYYRIPNVEP